MDIIKTNKVNYAFLSGWLHSNIKMLATDKKFLALKTDESRRKYLDAILKDADEVASSTRYTSHL